MILRGFISDEDGISQGVGCNDGQLFPRLDLSSSIDEADGRIIPHIAKAIQSVIVHSSDADVLAFILHYMSDLFRLGMYEVWIKYGTGNNKRYKPLHSLAKNLGETKSKLVMKILILSGCDVISKIGTKSAALNRKQMSTYNCLERKMLIAN